jgi:hypothetical protein
MVLPPSLGHPGPAPAVTVYTNGSVANRHARRNFFFQEATAAMASTSTS